MLTNSICVILEQRNQKPFGLWNTVISKSKGRRVADVLILGLGQLHKIGYHLHESP